MSERLQRLARLADLIKTREVSELATRMADRRAAETALARMQTHRREVLSRSGPDAAHLSGVGAAWLTLNARQIAAAAQAAAEAAARAEDKRPAARRALGRAQVLEELSRRDATGRSPRDQAS